MTPIELILKFARVATFMAYVFSGAVPAMADLQRIVIPSQDYVPSASAGGDSYSAIVSADSRWVLFASTANNLTPQSSNSISLSPIPLKVNVYCRDRSNGITTLASVNLAGVEANDDCTPIALSTNGQFALFESSASDLVTGDTNGVSDIFVRDLVGETTILVSVSTNGTTGDKASFDSVMTPDGRFVAFASVASNIVSGDANRISDIFVRDLQIGNTTLASVEARSALWRNVAMGGISLVPHSSSDTPGITPDGRYVVFESTATNLVLGVTNVGEIYVRDLIGEATYVVSTNAHAYRSGQIISYNPAISDDGQFVAFESSSNLYFMPGFIFRHHIPTASTQIISSNAVNSVRDIYEYSSQNKWSIQTLDMSSDGRFVAFVGRTNTGPGTTTTGVFVWDAQTATTRIISTNLDGSVEINSTCDLPFIDETGQFVSFLSTATNLTTNVVTGDFHLFTHDLATDITYLVDATTNGTGLMGLQRGVQSMTPGGRFVAFDSDNPNLVANDNNQSWDVFLRDLVTRTTELISAHDAAFPSQTAGPANSNYRLSMSADGRYVAFSTTAKGIAANSTNRNMAVYVRDLLNEETFLVSKDTNGLSNGNGASIEPVISGNGRYVAFTSSATNLVYKDGNRMSDVFVRDLNAEATTLISANWFGTGSGNGPSRSPSISYDGRYVLFLSVANDLTFPSFSFGPENLFLRDRVLRTNFALTTEGVILSSMTPDGCYVAFGDRPSNPVYYLWDVQAGRRIYTNTSPFSISPSGQRVAYLEGTQLKIWDRIGKTNQATISVTYPGLYSRIRFSADERFLVYKGATGFGVPPLSKGIYLCDIQTGTNTLISKSTNGLAANVSSAAPDISADGRFVVYSSRATNIVASDRNQTKDVFLHDRQSHTTVILSASAYGLRSANGLSDVPVFSGDGQTVMFQSFASDLMENDFNQGPDAFFLRLHSTNPIFAGQIVYVPGTDQPPTLSWIAPPGSSYRVEFKDDLTDAVWQPLDGSVSVVDDIGHATDLAPNPDHRFYRIVAE